MDTRELAQRLKTVEQSDTGSRLATAIFGSTQGLEESIDLGPRFRVGLWPCVSESEPETGMGLFAVLGYLLEQRQSSRVYRVFAAFEDDLAEDDYEWSLDQSQFDVDDWGIDDLDENVAIWGSLSQTDKMWQLAVNVENDLSEDEDDVIVLNYQAGEASAFVSLLPKVARDIVAALGLEDTVGDVLDYSKNELDDEAVQAMLRLLFHWERKLLLLLWDVEWPRDEVLDDYTALLATGRRVGGTFGPWSVASAVARAMLPGFGVVGNILRPHVEEIVEQFDHNTIPSAILARGLFKLGYAEETYSLLETVVAEKPKDVTAWMTLTELYGAGRRLIEAIDAFQRAIEAECANEPLYVNYAQLLLIMDYENREVEEFVLIDPDEYPPSSNFIVLEAVEALEAALDIDPNDPATLYMQINQLIENHLEDARFWPRFQQLVKQDDTGDLVRDVVDSFYALEDVSPGIAILKKAIAETPARCDLHINLASALMVDEDEAAARAELKKARTLTSDSDVLADIDRLMLSADDPDFETHLGDLTAILGAGKTAETEDVEFLERAVETVPTFSEGYLLLAKAYITWNEPGTALETLLDGEKHNPDDPEILEMLAKVLWDSGEQEVALGYLKKGLTKYPNRVSMLALYGMYLFENGQEDLAKAVLIRAQAISPRHPALQEAQVAIAKLLNREE